MQLVLKYVHIISSGVMPHLGEPVSRVCYHCRLHQVKDENSELERKLSCSSRKYGLGWEYLVLLFSTIFIPADDITYLEEES